MARCPKCEAMRDRMDIPTVVCEHRHAELVEQVDRIRVLLRAADEAHTDFVFVPDIDAILGTRYGA